MDLHKNNHAVTNVTYLCLTALLSGMLFVNFQQAAVGLLAIGIAVLVNPKLTVCALNKTSVWRLVITILMLLSAGFVFGQLVGQLVGA